MRDDLQSRVTGRLRNTLKYHLNGLKGKIEEDFSKGSFDSELDDLRGDPVYRRFFFDSPEYVLVRLMGRISISIGRRLGEIYDKVPRYVTAERFSLSKEQVAPKLNKLELDIGIPLEGLSQEDTQHVKSIATKHFRNYNKLGLGIEIRYNFNPNDSSRLRKDVEMANLLISNKYFPIYLIYCSISPRNDAISRLTKAGWNFLVGDQANAFMTELLEIDISRILEVPSIRDDIQKQVNSIMKEMFETYAFKEALKSSEQ